MQYLASLLRYYHLQSEHDVRRVWHNAAPLLSNDEGKICCDNCLVNKVRFRWDSCLWLWFRPEFL
jgi:hypothetical protein